MRLVDIALLSKDIHDKISLDCNDISPISIISDTTPCIKTQISKYFKNKVSISVRSTDITNSEQVGMFRKYNIDNNESIIINVSNALNSCWSRFVATKELVHSIIGDYQPKTQTTDILELISSLVEQKNFKIDDEVSPEYTAWIFAVELLLPYCHDNIIMDSDNYTSYQIAEMFKVPEQIVDTVRTEDYRKLRTKCYEDLD